jgi:ABC-type lipoprotein export system ATPase subunit
VQITTLTGPCAGIELSPGSSCQLIAASTSQKQALLDSLQDQVKTSIVWPDGGLISNLPLRENIALPAEFHQIGSDADRASRMQELLPHFGDDAKALNSLWHARPAQLSLFHKRLAGFMRAMLIEPQLIVFDCLFDGISRANAARVREFKRIFHLYFPFRHVMFVNFAEEPLLQGLVGQTRHL